MQLSEKKLEQQKSEIELSEKMDKLRHELQTSVAKQHLDNEKLKIITIEKMSCLLV